MSDIKAWSPNANENNAAAPHGAPEGMPVSSVNDTMREMMAAVRRQFEQAGFFDPGYTPTRLADDKFTVTDDRTSVFLVGQRVKFSDGGVKYGTITASEYTTLTTVTVSLDDSGTLSASLSAVAVGISPDAVKEPPVVPVATTDQAGTVELATAEELHAGGAGKIADAAQIKALLDARDARDARLFFQQAAQQNLDRQSFAAGVLDVFTDTSDIDLEASVNERYNAADDYFDISQDEAFIANHPSIGNMTGGGGLAAAFDRDNSKTKTECASAVGATTYIGKDWGSGQSKIIKKVQIWGASDSGFEDGSTGEITLRLQGSDDNFSSAVDLGSVTFTNTLDNTMREIVPSSTTAYRYHRIAVEATSSNATNFVAELLFYEEQSGGSGSIQSNAFAAGSAPARVDAHLWHEALENIALNTDLVLSVSRDNGDTWEAATLAKDSDMATGQLLRASGVDVSGQPSGTQIKYKVEFNNNKAQRLHGVSLQWG